MANRTVSVRLIADVSQYVSGMSRASRSLLQLGQASGGAGGQAQGAFDLAGKSALLMGGLAVAGFGNAISKAMEFQSSMSAVQAATQGSVGTMADLRDAAMQAGADTAYSATEAADAITEMAKAGVSTADIMGGGLTGALSLAAAGQLDVAKAAEIASVAMTQFHLSGEDLPHVADLLAAGAGKAMGSVEDLGMALNQAGLVASASGLSIEETTGTLAAFASAGLLGSDAGTSLRSMLQHLQNPSKEAAAQMSALGVSLYDSSGEFAGMDNLAGQLRQSLGGLNSAQRDAALSVIFGSDAVRAANVLYTEGASGIQDWTNNVNDAGYATDQAAALQDNLAGDLEKLSGSFDTLMIAIGTGTLGPLSLLTDGLTAVINVVAAGVTAFSSLPGPVIAAIGVMGALLLLNGPLAASVNQLAASFLGVVTGAGMATVGMGAFTVVSTVARTAAAGFMSALGGPLGLALIGATAGLGLLVSWLSDSSDASNEAAGSTDNLTEALHASKGAMDDTVRAAAAKDLQSSGALDFFEGLGVNLDLVTDAALGVPGALDQVQAAVSAQMNQDAVAGTVGAAINQGYQDRVDTLGEMAGTTATAVAAEQQLAAATGDTGVVMAEATAEVVSFTDQASAAKNQIDEFKAALDSLTGANVSMLEAENAVGEAVAAATGALEGKTGAVLNDLGALNSNTEAGRAASDVLLNLRDAAQQQIATLEQQGASTADVTAQDAYLRSSFIQTAEQMGISEEAANTLADQILGIPAERATQILMDTNPAERALVELTRDRYMTITANTQPGTTARNTAVADLARRTDRAAGGYIAGPGSATSDSIPANLSNGEYVVRASSVHKYGTGFLDAVNAGNFANGGLAGIPGPIHATVAPGSTVGPQWVLESDAPTAGPGGALGSTFNSLFAAIKAIIPSARMNDGYRPGAKDAHGRGKAVDFGFGSGPGGAGSAGLALINRTLYDQYKGSLYELIYDGLGDDRPDVKSSSDHNYGKLLASQHRNHVHAAIYDQGGVLGSGTAGINMSGLPEAVLTNAQWKAIDSMATREISGSGSGAPNVTVQARVFVGDREITDIVRVEAATVVSGAVATISKTLAARGVR